MKKAVREMSVTFEPWAECLGIDDETPCPSSWSMPEPSSFACDLGKRHAELFHGHRVRVVVEKVDLYRVKKS